MPRPKRLQEDVERLCKRALELGACQARSLSVSKVVVDPRVRLKCSVPVCDGYGRNRMCPPSTISVEEFSESLARYSSAIVVQFDMEWSEEDVKRSFKGKALESLHREDAYLERMTKVMREMSGALNALEKEALYMGYRFAAALTGGCCRLCDECVGPDPKERCRHPFQARPSMEAVGIDVVATAQNAGLRIIFPPKGRAVWTGLLLVE